MMKYYDRAWNPVFGCQGGFAGCEHCYAKGQMLKRGFCDDFTRVDVNRKQLERKFDKGTRELICICTQSDLFQPDVRRELVDRVLRICDDNRQNSYMTLTKFTANLAEYLGDPELLHRLSHNGMKTVSLDNMAFGATMCGPDDLHRLDELKNAPLMAHRFLSFEPLLEDVAKYMDVKFLEGFDWIIAGAETGEGRRKCPADWLEGIVELADKAGIPVFVNAVDLGDRLAFENRDKPVPLRRNDIPYAVK